MKPFVPPSLRHFTPDYMAFSTWVDHIPFGYDLVAAMKPKVLVELGTQHGISFFCFCQSMKDHDIDGICYAIDTWNADQHSGSYDNSVFETVQKHARRNYGHFSYLLRMLFKDALQQFSNESIDLLHIDGLHTYEAVSEDFRDWYPKVKPGGIILFHDILARFSDFGAWKFWEELEKEHSTFIFKHGFGLGVLKKEGGNNIKDPLLDMLFDQDEETTELLRAFYAHAALFHKYQRKITMQHKRQQMKQLYNKET